MIKIQLIQQACVGNETLCNQPKNPHIGKSKNKKKFGFLLFILFMLAVLAARGLSMQVQLKTDQEIESLRKSQELIKENKIVQQKQVRQDEKNFRKSIEKQASTKISCQFGFNSEKYSEGIIVINQADSVSGSNQKQKTNDYDFSVIQTMILEDGQTFQIKMPYFFDEIGLGLMSADYKINKTNQVIFLPNLQIHQDFSLQNPIVKIFFDYEEGTVKWMVNDMIRYKAYFRQIRQNKWYPCIAMPKSMKLIEITSELS